MELETIVLIITAIATIITVVAGFAGICYKLGKFSQKVESLEAKVKTLENDCDDHNDVIIKVQTSLEFIVTSINEIKVDLKEMRNDTVQRENRGN